MPEFTPMQKEAIYKRDCNLLVSAAAGSGKTAVLSERVLSLLIDEENPASVDSLLVVTFTNAAAAEMKERIAQKISEKLTGKISKKLWRHLTRQLVLMGKASITTIHSFCLELIRNNFHLLDIDPAFRIADDSEAKILKNLAAEDMLEYMYATDPVFPDLVYWLTGGSDDRFIAEVFKVFGMLMSMPDYRQWITRQVEVYAETEDINNIPWVSLSRDGYLQKLLDYISEYRLLVSEAENTGVPSLCEAYLSDISSLEHIASLFDGEWDILQNEISAFSYTRATAKKDEAPFAEPVKKRRDELKKNISALFDNILALNADNILPELPGIYRLLCCFKDSVLKFADLFAERKKEKSVIDFNDFEHFAIQLLSDSSNGIAEKLKNRYEHIFVDEYQDCNATQERIFSYISRKKDNLPYNMFMVGDVKQSIYCFRNADPSIFTAKAKSYTSGEGLQQKICLNKNFRSNYAILEGVNSVFKKAMSERAGGLDYTESEWLYYRSDEPQKIKKKEKCELTLIETAEDTEKSFGEARYIAERITEFVEKGYKYSDIVILMRGTEGKTDAIETALRMYNIPYFTEGSANYFESLEMRIFLSLLKICDNPLQDIPLAGVLRSPLFNFTEEDLLKIRSASRGNFYDAMIKYQSQSGNTALKCRNFLNKLSVWRDMSVSLQIDEFCEYILRDTGLISFAVSLPGGEERVANINLLLELARSFKNNGFKSLFSFVTHLDKMKTEKKQKGPKLSSENSNLVRIMTIHKSKGLEFPVVFLARCSAEFNLTDSRGSLVLHKDFGFGVNCVNFEKKVKYPFVSKSIISEQIRAENVSEEMRVLYVAMTRAKEKLICTAEVKGAADLVEKNESLMREEKLSATKSGSAKCYLDWLLPSLSDNWTLNIIENTEELAEETPEESADTERPISDFDPSEILGYRYPYEQASKLPTKFSVSELKRRYDFNDVTSVKLYNTSLKSRPSFMSDEKITASQAGTINHLILKEIPIKAVTADDVSRCVQSLIDRGLLTEEESKVANTDAICGFFSSPTGKRLINSLSYHRELPFNIAFDPSRLFTVGRLNREKVLVQGIIDLIFEEPGGLVIVDFKTDKMLTAESKKSYATQLMIYAEAAEKLLKKPVKETFLYLLSQNKEYKF